MPADTVVDPVVRARAGWLVVAPDGSVGGYSAAELLGASCGPADADVEVVSRRYHKQQLGLIVRRELIARADLRLAAGIRVTSALRTAYDLARRPGPVTDSVIAVDALARVGGFAPDRLLEVAERLGSTRGCTRLPDVIKLADRRSGSPMETRIRLALVQGGLPPPALQFPVGPYFLDLAYPEVRLGIEYDGQVHRTQHQAHRDLQRESCLAAAGWTGILRFTAAQVFRPELIATWTRRALRDRGYFDQVSAS